MLDVLPGLFLEYIQVFLLCVSLASFVVHVGINRYANQFPSSALAES